MDAADTPITQPLKRCTKCGEEKDAESGFHKDKSRCGGFHNICKECRCKKTTEWQQKNVARHLETNKKWQENNRDKCHSSCKKWYENNREKHNEDTKQWKLSNPDKRREYEKKWRENNRNKSAESHRRWRAKNPEKRRAIEKKWRDENREYTRAQHLLHKFSLSTEDYTRILAEQGGVCVICKEPPKSGQNLAVDHDHSCCPGKTTCGRCIRALLCGSCNRAIGLLKESPAILRTAAEYLENHNARQSVESAPES